ncbi:MAG: hypothetical protein IE926_16395, partial [Micrococcales bacterium]|nr:hypothetical protein [Micrococcales bacterium]
MKSLLSRGQRDRSRALLTVLSGALAASAVAATGAATAAVARETAHHDAVKAQAKAEADAKAAKEYHDQLVAWAKAHPVVVQKARKTKRVVARSVIVT